MFHSFSLGCMDCNYRNKRTWRDFLMKKIDKVCIWLTLLLPVLCSQYVYAEKYEGNWYSSQGSGSIHNANSLQDITDDQYTFNLTQDAEVNIRLTAFADTYLFLFSTNDSENIELVYDDDGDGVSDADEGYDDSDNDGIVDYMDNIAEPNLAPIGEDSNRLLQSPEGTQLVLGEMAFANAKNSTLVSKEKLIQLVSQRQLQLSEGIKDESYIYPFGLYDFTISGAIPGRSYYLVIPISLAIEEGQIFRKYMGSEIGWQNFIENANNTLFSAKAIDGACPEPASRLYDYGLQSGNNCMQIYIEDGGPNDADGKVDGIVTDPAGIAEYIKPTESNNSVSNDDENLVAQDPIKPVEEDSYHPVEASEDIQDGAPSSKHSKLKLSQSVIYTGGNTAVLTVEAKSVIGELLKTVELNAWCTFCADVKIHEFKQTKQGHFEALISSGRQISFGYIQVELSNQYGSAKLEHQKLNVIYRPSGGCTTAANGRSDISLFLMLMLLTLYHRRKKPLV
jgi:hypothetical protein